MTLIRPSAYWRHVNPRGMLADFREVVRQAGPNKWRIGLLSAVCTGCIFSVMLQEGAQGPPHPPKVTYIRVWDPHRTEAQIIASNIENQKRKERLAAEQSRREEDVRQMYKTVGRMSGLNVDAMEARANAERKRAGLAPLPAASVTPRP